MIRLAVAVAAILAILVAASAAAAPIVNGADLLLALGAIALLWAVWPLFSRDFWVGEHPYKDRL